MNPPRNKSVRRVNCIALTKMVKAMQEGPHTLHDMVEVTGLAIMTVRHYVLSMHAEQVVHIDHWEQDSRDRYTTPAYVMGPGKDAKRPVVGQKESNRRYRARQQMKRVLDALQGTAA